MSDRRPQRTDCPQCGRRVTLREDGLIGPHLIRKAEDGVQTPIPRCSGGLVIPADGLIVEVQPDPVVPAPHYPEDSGASVRTVRGGIPGSNRRH
jgi:hypothetical protein